MLGAVVPIVGGLIASSGFVVSRKPNAQQLIDKLTPYQGWIGIVLFVWGLREAFFVATSVSMIAEAPLHYVFWLCAAVADLAVGFLLGFGLITKYALNRNATAMAKGHAIRARLTKIQAPLGLFGIATGVAFLLLYLI